jgi:hypothetical protein
MLMSDIEYELKIRQMAERIGTYRYANVKALRSGPRHACTAATGPYRYIARNRGRTPIPHGDFHQASTYYYQYHGITTTVHFRQ